MLDRVNNSASEQTGNEDQWTKNNENIRERIPTTLEEKHATIVTASHVNKSMVKRGREGDTTLGDRNGSRDIPGRWGHSDIIAEDEVEARSPHVPQQPHTLDSEIYEELASYIREEPPDRFSDAVEEQSYDEQRSLLVIGCVHVPRNIL